MPAVKMSYMEFSRLDGVSVEKTCIPNRAINVVVNDVPQGNFTTFTDSKLGAYADVQLRTPIVVGGSQVAQVRVTDIS